MGGGVSDGRFSTKKKTKKTNMGLKHWILPNNQFKTHLFFFNFWVGATLFSLDLGPKGGSNFKALWRSHLTSVRGPISYRIRFMTRRPFFVFLFFFPLGGGGAGALGKIPPFFFFFFEPFPKS